MDTNKSVTATFTQNVYTLTTTIIPVGSGTINVVPASPYHYNDVVTLTANAYTWIHLHRMERKPQRDNQPNNHYHEREQSSHRPIHP